MSPIGIVNRNKINVRKEYIEGSLNFYIDCNKLQDPSTFKSSLLMNMIRGYHCLVLIDTKLEYARDRRGTEQEIHGLLAFLEEHSIRYRKIEEKDDNNGSILGIPIRLNTKEKSFSYKVGFCVLEEQLEEVRAPLEHFNAYYFLITDEFTDEEVLLNFFEVRGDIEELRSKYQYSFYYDSFMKKIRISTDDVKALTIEQEIKSILNECK